MGRTSPAMKVNIPTVLIEDEPMETECLADRHSEEDKTRRKVETVRKSKKGRSSQPRSPEKGRTYYQIFIKQTSATTDEN